MNLNRKAMIERPAELARRAAIELAEMPATAPEWLRENCRRDVICYAQQVEDALRVEAMTPTEFYA